MWKKEVAALLEQDKSVAEIAAATGLSESSVKLYCSILKVRPKEAQGLDDALPEPQDDAEADENWDQGPVYRKPEEAAASATGISKRREPEDEDEIDAKIRELHALKLTDKQIAQKIGKSKCGICQRRNRMGLPTNEKKGRLPGVRRSGMAAEEGEYPIIGGTKENPVYGSMRMKVVEEKAVDGHKVRVLPPGYAMGAEPAKNVAVRS
jgi:hypothetical protein